MRAITANSGQNEPVNNCSYLDLTVKQDGQHGVVTSKGNGIVTPTSLADVVGMDGNISHTPNQPESPYNTPVCMVSHMPSNINQELAEADQSMENDATNNENVEMQNSPDQLNAPERGEIIPESEISNEGAVGGIDASPLPDLAKVSTITNCEVDFLDTDL